jgi:hypothetical protein
MTLCGNMHRIIISRFSCHDWKLDPVSLNKLRAARVLEFGMWLLKQDSHRLVTRRYYLSCPHFCLSRDKEI